MSADVSGNQGENKQTQVRASAPGLLAKSPSCSSLSLLEATGHSSKNWPGTDSLFPILLTQQGHPRLPESPWLSADRILPLPLSTPHAPFLPSVRLCVSSHLPFPFSLCFLVSARPCLFLFSFLFVSFSLYIRKLYLKQTSWRFLLNCNTPHFTYVGRHIYFLITWVTLVSPILC